MKRPIAIAVIGLLLASGLWVALINTKVYGSGTNIIILDSKTTYQSIVSWEATAWAMQDSSPAFANYSDELFDLAINDLGLNRLRVEVRSGAENQEDYWSQYQTGDINYSEWRSHRYSTVNDNSDPYVINWTGFQFSELDNTIEKIVLPMKQVIEAKGEKLYVNVNYVAFTSQIGQGLEYIHDDPEEYAEFVLATYLHLQSNYSLVPDYWEMILEPDNVAEWDGTLIGNAIVAAANRLDANGFNPSFVAPSTTSMANAISYFDAMIAVPGALGNLSEYSYHRYSGVSDNNLRAIANRGTQYRINTSMLEHIGSGYQDLHKDLKIGNNSAWQQYVLAGGSGDSGGKYYLIDDSDPANPIITMGSRTKFLRQYFKFVRSCAVRIGATTNNNSFDPVAFINIDGQYVVVVKADAGGSISIQGLPAGAYGIKYTTSSQYDVDLANKTIGTSGMLNTSIPASGVLTVYAINYSPPINNSIFLNQGWNLISIPFIQSYTNLGTVLSSITGSYDAVQWYNATDPSDPWKHNHTSKPSHLNDLDSINHAMGFWIHVTKPGGVLFQYFGTQASESQNITLYLGWNLVGYPSLSNKTRSAALNNIDFANDVDSIWAYNASNQKWEEIGETDYFEVGRGYWVHAKKECVWEVPL